MCALPSMQVCKVDPVADTLWHGLRQHIATDGIHLKDNVKPGLRTRGMGHRSWWLRWKEYVFGLSVGM